jgi:hypothetical protein
LLATFWRQATEGSSYWRCEIPARHLPGRVNKLIPADIEETKDGLRFPHQAGQTAIWQFSGSATRGILMAEMQEQGYRVLMEVDDNYLEAAPYMPAWQIDFARGGNTEDGDLSSIAAHTRIAGWCDGVIVSTPFLAERYARVNDQVYVCPNSVDPDDWPDPLPREDDVLRIGWAASHSHFVDAPLARRALKWAVKQPNVKVYLIGYQPQWRGPFLRVPWTDNLADYCKQLINLKLDVGLCPLLPGVWADAKSDVKALEYAMAGAMPVMSMVEPYRPWFDKSFCLLAKNPKGWENALRWCVLHRDEVRAMAAEARLHVLAERTIRDSIGAWREACHAPVSDGLGEGEGRAA